MQMILHGLAVDLPSVHTKLYELQVAAPPEEVWKFFSTVEALAVLTPPNRRMKQIGSERAVVDGALHVMRIWVFGLVPVIWKSRISQVTPPYGFTDQAEKSPFQFWRHRHDMIPTNGGTLIRDIVAYIVPFGKLGKAVNKLFVGKDLDRLFEHRHRVLRERFGTPQSSESSATH